MIDKIQIIGLKSFSDYTLKLGRLTVLTGLNNSGKSTAIQALRMCAAAGTEGSPYLQRHGDYSELKSDLTASGDPIRVILHKGKVKARLTVDHDGFEVRGAKHLPLLQYIAADRFGPMVELPTRHDNGAMLTAGERGEYSAHFASTLESCQIVEILRHETSSSNTLKHQLAAWMSEITPGVRLNFDIQKKYDASRLEVDGKRATNSGFGISYTLPILLLLLAMTAHIGSDNSDTNVVLWFEKIKRDGGMLLIENPEAHLHPRGQTALGRMLVLAATAGLQIVVETHSDHLIDGVRLGVRNTSQIDPADVQLRFFQKNLNAPSQVADIQVFRNGKLSAWPPGFFDQMSKNLRLLSSREPEV